MTLILSWILIGWAKKKKWNKHLLIWKISKNAQCPVWTDYYEAEIVARYGLP